MRANSGLGVNGMLRLEIVALYAGVNILLLLVLGYLVTQARRTHKIVLGDGGHDATTRAIRALPECLAACQPRP